METSLRLTSWIIDRTKATRTPVFFTIPGSDQPPEWDYEEGYTEWHKGRPKKYHRVQSTVTVGDLWLAQIFPAAVARMRLYNTGQLDATLAELADAEAVLEIAARQQHVSYCRAYQYLVDARPATFEPETEYAYA